MKEWVPYKLKEITTKIGSGSTPTGGKEAYYQSGITLVRSLNIYDFVFELQNLAYINEAQAKKLNGVTIEKDDILLNITGASVGRCTIIPEYLLPARVNQHVSIIRCDKEKVDAKFLLYCINSTSYKDALMSIADSGATREALTKDDIEKFQVLLPSLPIQQRIASILSAYDDLIEVNNQRIKLLEETARELYKEWFVRMRFPGYKEAKFVKGVPEGWEVTTLADEVNFKMGQSPKSEFYNDDGNGLPFHQGVGTYGQRFPEHKIFCSVNGRTAEEGDILFSVRAPVGRLNIADRKLIIGRGLSAMRHKKGLNNYLYYLLQHEFSKEDIIGNGSIFNSVGKDELKRFKIFQVGDFAKQFNNWVKPIDEQLLILIQQNTQLRQIRDRLLPRLIGGKLEVKENIINPETTVIG